MSTYIIYVGQQLNNDQSTNDDSCLSVMHIIARSHRASIGEVSVNMSLQEVIVQVSVKYQ